MEHETYAPIIEKYLPRIKQMRFLDDDFMSAAFDDNNESTQFVLRTILGRDDLQVQSVTAQREFKNIYGRSVRLDVYATDKAGRQYDVEIQRADRGAGERRARYHQSIMDTNHLPAGASTEQLPEVYVIFFTEHDVRGKNFPIYHVERVIRETGERFEDGEHIIYVNGAYQDDGSALGSLIADFRESDPDKLRNAPLAKRMKYLKENGKGRDHMCRIMEELIKEERAEVRHEEFLRSVKKMREKGFSMADMADISERPEAEVIAALHELGLSVPN